MENIQITLPDGSTREVPGGTTAAQVAGQIGPRLAKDALVARVDGELVDLSKPLDRSAKLSILTAKDPDAVQVFRHSAAHLLAAAVLELYPNVKPVSYTHLDVYKRQVIGQGAIFTAFIPANIPAAAVD